MQSTNRNPKTMNRPPTMPPLFSLCACGILAMPLCVFAQEDDASQDAQLVETTQATEPARLGILDTANQGRLHLNLGVDTTNAYFFRGIVQEDDSFAIQPWVEVEVDLFESNEYQYSAFLGLWNSIHGEATVGGAGTDDEFLENWYEATPYVGFSVAHDRWAVRAWYSLYTSPEGAFETIEEAAVSIAFDDSDLLFNGFALNPSITVAIETGRDFRDDADSDQGIYVEPAIEPAVVYESDILGDITLSMPMRIGLSAKDYYQDVNGGDEIFGFYDFGLKSSFNLPIHRDYGKWTLDASFHFLILGDNPQEYNDEDDTDAFFILGLTLRY